MNVTYMSIFDAANTIAYKTKPILFCDTCALLDIIRLPLREKSSSRLIATLKSISNILSMVDNKDIILVSPPPILLEWQEHASYICEELAANIDIFSAKYAIIKATAAHQGTNLPPLSISSQAIAQHYYNLSERLLCVSIILNKEDAPSLCAVDRATSCIAPARKGTIKDCLIYEHMLKLIDELIKKGFSAKRVFITSNTNDFCDERNNPKPPIDDELSVRSTIFCTNWNWAYSIFRP